MRGKTKKIAVVLVLSMLSTLFFSFPSVFAGTTDATGIVQDDGSILYGFTSVNREETGSGWATWSTSNTTVPDCSRGYTGSNTSTVTAFFDVPTAGKYEVIFVNKAGTTAASLTSVNNLEKVDTPASASQTLNLKTSAEGTASSASYYTASAGTFFLNAGSNSVLQHRNADSGYFRFDAVLIKPVETDPEATPAPIVIQSRKNVGNTTGTPVAPANVELDNGWAQNSGLTNSLGMAQTIWSGTEKLSAKYRPSVPKAGWYTVSFWYVYHTTNSPAQFKANIYGNGVLTSDITAPSEKTEGLAASQWVTIGDYYFSGGEQEFLQFVNTPADSSKQARLAEVKFTYAEDQSAPAPTPTPTPTPTIGATYTISANSNDLNYAESGTWGTTGDSSLTVSDAVGASLHRWSSTKESYATFTLPAGAPDGYYTVEYYMTGADTAGSFTVDGTSAALQSRELSKWNNLGSGAYPLTRGSNVKLTVTSGNARATSIRFTYLGTEAPEVVIDGETQSDGSIWYKTQDTNIRRNTGTLASDWANGYQKSTDGAVGIMRSCVLKQNDTENKITTDSYMEISINVPAADTYCLQFIGKYQPNYGKIQIDGGELMDMKEVSTLAHGTQRADTAGYFDFTAGTHVIRLYHDGLENHSIRLDVVSLKKAQMHTVSLINQIGTVSGAGTYAYGESVTVRAEGNTEYEFDYWQEGERIVSDEGEYTFVVSGDRELTAQFKPVNAETYDVVFKDINGVVLATMPVAAGGTLNETDITAVTQPSKPGKIFDGWDKSFPLAVNGKTIVTAKYRADETSEKYTVIANGETIADQVPFDTKVTVTASAEKEGESFSYWKDGNEKIVSYKSEYSFYVSGNISLTAVYGDSTTVVVPVVKTDNVMIDKTNSKMSFVSQISLPEGYELIECGTLISKTAGDFTIETEGVTKVKARTQTAAGQYMASLTNVTSGAVRYARGYLIYKGPDGSITTIYGNTVSGTME